MGSCPRIFRPKFLKAYHQLAAAILVAFSLVVSPFAAVADFTVVKVIDGDTIRIGGVPDIRLLQIDTPELGEECYAKEAKNALEVLIGDSPVSLQSDPKLSDMDNRKKRLAQYVFLGDKNLNLELVKMGAAAPWFYGGKGIYARELRAAAEEARLNNLGLWGACPGTKLNTSKGVSTGKVVKVSPSPSKSNSDQNFVNAGSYCKESQKGEERLGKNGILYTCKVSESENRLRWRK